MSIAISKNCVSSFYQLAKDNSKKKESVKRKTVDKIKFIRVYLSKGFINQAALRTRKRFRELHLAVEIESFYRLNRNQSTEIT